MTEMVEERYVHWVTSGRISLHANGPASFRHKTQRQEYVTCRLCLYLLERIGMDA